MSKHKRIYFNNAVYHICIRGNNRQRVIGADDDKIIFLMTLNKFRLRFKFKLYAFVLMDNHIHLVIGTGSNITISKIMQAITLSYSQLFRRKYNYSGYVWQGRFKSKIIDGDKYILECINYIHNNPLRSGMAESVSDYPYSSYHFYNSLRSPVSNYININLYGGI
ncbi:MAG: transposase [Candidatus Omnitrophota bacterium]